MKNDITVEISTGFSISLCLLETKPWPHKNLGELKLKKLRNKQSE